MNKSKVRFPPTGEELEKIRNMSPEEKRLRNQIAFEKRRFEHQESSLRHRMELGVVSSKDYRRIVRKAEERMERNVEVLEYIYEEKFGGSTSDN